MAFRPASTRERFFGIGQGSVSFFSLMSVIAAIAIVFWLFVAKAARDWLVTIACGLICAGILGNLYDGLACPGSTGTMPTRRSTKWASPSMPFVIGSSS